MKQFPWRKDNQVIGKKNFASKNNLPSGLCMN